MYAVTLWRGAPRTVQYQLCLDAWSWEHIQDAVAFAHCRPLSTPALAYGVLASQKPSNPSFRVALRDEIRALRLLSDRNPMYSGIPADTGSGSSVWSSRVLLWAETCVTTPPRAYADGWIETICAAMDRREYRRALSALSRLAIELSGDGSPQHDRLWRFLKAAERRDTDVWNPVDFQAFLCEAVVGPQPMERLVRLALTPVTVTRAVSRTNLGVMGLRPIAIREPDGRHLISQLEVRGMSRSSHEAVATATRAAEEYISRLRLQHHATAKLYGSAVVVADGVESSHPIPPMFWTKTVGARALPHLNGQWIQSTRQLDVARRDKLEAASAHAHSAIEQWQRDRNASALSSWAATEALFGGGARVVIESLPDIAARGMTEDATRHVAQSLGRFAVSERDKGRRYLWHLPRRTESLARWRQHVTDGGVRDGLRWRPDPPVFLFDRDVGLLRWLGTPRGTAMVARRVGRDLKLLYGVRNHVAHTGHSPLPEHCTGYLSRVVTEALLLSLGYFV